MPAIAASMQRLNELFSQRHAFRNAIRSFSSTAVNCFSNPAGMTETLLRTTRRPLTRQSFFLGADGRARTCHPACSSSGCRRKTGRWSWLPSTARSPGTKLVLMGKGLLREGRAQLRGRADPGQIGAGLAADVADGMAGGACRLRGVEDNLPSENVARPEPPGQVCRAEPAALPGRAATWRLAGQSPAFSTLGPNLWKRMRKSSGFRAVAATASDSDATRS